MALDDILRKIREDAEAEAAEILRKARAEQERVLALGRERAQVASDRIDAAATAAADDARRRELATASVEIRRIALSAKQEVLEQVFERALAGLAELPEAEYHDLLADLAVRATVSGDEQIIVSKRDRARLGADWLAKVNRLVAQRGLQSRLTFSEATREVRGGLILQAGQIEVNATFERTLASLRDALEPEIATLLFDPAEDRRSQQ